MDWIDIAITVLRSLIGDLDNTNYTFSDERLTQIIYVSASFVATEIDFTNDYVVDLENSTITPDPISDSDFTNFTALKAACMIDRGNARIAAAASGINAKCGPVSMATGDRMQAAESLLKNGYCNEYTTASLQYSFGNAAYIRAVMSPFTNSTFDPELYNSNIRLDRNLGA